MKINVEIDCTPDEARQFLGLPDVKPMQAKVMATIEAQMMQAAERFSPDALLRTWMSFVPQTPERLKDAVQSFFRAATERGAQKPEG